MSSVVQLWLNDDEDLSSGHLLRDIEELSKALYLPKKSPEALNPSPDHRSDVEAKTRFLKQKSKVSTQNSLHKANKSSIWKWKPLKALTHIRNRKFNCCFFLHVHVIEGLPSDFNNLSMSVTWMPKGDLLTTRPAQVCEGMAEFEETLMHRCTVYGSRNGRQNSSKYEPKLFLLHISVIEAPTLDIGKHWIDLTRLLPLTFEELEEDKRSSGKWTTSFKLTGRAKGAMVNVSFGFSILGDSSNELGYVKVPNIVRERRTVATDHLGDFDWTSGTNRLHRLGIVRKNSTRGSHRQSKSLDFQLLDETSPNGGLPHSVDILYQSPDEGRMGNFVEFDFFHGHSNSLTSNSGDGSTVNVFDDIVFTVIEQGVEISVKDHEKNMELYACQNFGSSLIETINVAEIFEKDDIIYAESPGWNTKLEVNGNNENENAKDDCEYTEGSACIKEQNREEFDSVFSDLFTCRSEEMNSLLDIAKYYELENYWNTKSSYKGGKLEKSLCLDEFADSIANDFLNMLSIERNPDDKVSDSGPESPKDSLLSQFEENTFGWDPIFHMDKMAEEKSISVASTGNRKVACSDDFEFSLAVQEGERKNSSAAQSLTSKINARMLENLETEALMHEWGLNEKAFQIPPHISSGGFGSPVYLPAEEPLKLPSLGDNIGPIIQTKDGGLLRSMNPLLFRNSKNGARLIMQVSAPVVLPVAMGTSIMEMLQCWASQGAERMSAQANEMMALEDITGKTIQQVMSEAESRSDTFRWTLQHEKLLRVPQNSDAIGSCSKCKEIESDYICYENLLPQVTTHVEPLLIEGLKIQSNMPGQEAPSTIRVKSVGKLASLGKSVKLGRDFLDIDELIRYSLSLEEWIRLDAGDFDIEDKNSERIVKILSANLTEPIEWCGGQLTKDDESCGVFGKNFTMGLNVQLRNPLRNYEMVGSSMLALIQVERVYLPQQREENGQEDGQSEQLVQERIHFEQKLQREENGEERIYFEQKQNIHENLIPLFKISDIHLTGLNVELGDKQLWGATRKLQTGSRWLFTSGMSSTTKRSISNSNAIIKSSTQTIRKACAGDVLWSISPNIQGEAAIWDEHVALNIHRRNADIIFPN